MLDIHKEAHTQTHMRPVHTVQYIQPHIKTHNEILQRQADEMLKGEKKRIDKGEGRNVKCRKSPESTTTSELHTCQGESLAAGGMCQSEAPV